MRTIVNILNNEYLLPGELYNDYERNFKPIISKKIGLNYEDYDIVLNNFTIDEEQNICLDLEWSKK